MTSDSLLSLWPAAGVGARAGNLKLRWIDDDLALDLARLAARGVHAPDRMPFHTPWTRGSSEDVARRVLAYQWAARSEVGPRGSLKLEYAVVERGTVVGVQGASGTDWQLLRSVETGSWLGREFHGRGIGTRMRALMLHLLFDGLGADEVTSRAFDDNPASNAVSLKVGYLPDGTMRVVRDGDVAIQNCFAMTRERWESVRHDSSDLLGAPVSLSGTQALRERLDADGCPRRTTT